MTGKDVWDRVAEIRALAGDDEAAHSAEDKLWRDVLELIAKGAPNPRELANIALATQEVAFDRWCA